LVVSFFDVGLDFIVKNLLRGLNFQFFLGEEIGGKRGRKDGFLAISESKGVESMGLKRRKGSGGEKGIIPGEGKGGVGSEGKSKIIKLRSGGSILKGEFNRSGVKDVKALV